MKAERVKQITDCCNGIIRNAEYICKDMEYDLSLTITIEIEPDSIPTVAVVKRFIPKEFRTEED